MKKDVRKKLIEGHDDFFMQMGQACNHGEAAEKQSEDFDRQTAELFASWLEYNARHGEKMRRSSGKKRNGKRN